jgi:hypothetical protein
MQRLILTVAVAVLAGCGMGQMFRADRFEDVARVYASAISWSDFAKAHALVTDERTATPFDESGYQNIKVTAYEPGNAAPAGEATTLKRRAQLRYVEITRMSERSLTTQEEWRYVEAEKRWYLDSGFPQFK